MDAGRCWRLQGSSRSDMKQLHGTLFRRVRSGLRGCCRGRNSSQELARAAATVALWSKRVLRVRCHVSQRRGLLVRLSRRVHERGGGRQVALSNGDVQRGTDREPCLQNDAGKNVCMDLQYATYTTRVTRSTVRAECHRVDR